MKDLFEYTLGKLSEHYATRSVALKVKKEDYNVELAKEICALTWNLAGSREEYDLIIEHLISFSKEFLELQMELDKTGSYACSSFDEARQKVYDNPEVMDKRYLYGLLLSQAFWTNHLRILEFFMREFCAVSAKGSILEVPVGTGIFISQFMKRNPGWKAKAYDISESSVAFAKRLSSTMVGIDIQIEKANVFDLSEEKYDMIICGELLEHLENPEDLLLKLKSMLKEDGKLFLTTAVWAASVDHIYLFRSSQEVRDMLSKYFRIETEVVLNVFARKGPEDEKTPINYGAILSKP